ncbi:MAG: hypothetical protein LBP52_10585 [Burkholderiaceae bacterium]|nr:hypothetical protein [Burkholderiaceae bacterium]
MFVVKRFYRKAFSFPHGQHAASSMPTNFSSTASVIFHNPFLAKDGLGAQATVRVDVKKPAGRFWFSRGIIAVPRV